MVEDSRAPPSQELPVFTTRSRICRSGAGGSAEKYLYSVADFPLHGLSRSEATIRCITLAMGEVIPMLEMKLCCIKLVMEKPLNKVLVSFSTLI